MLALGVNVHPELGRERSHPGSWHTTDHAQRRPPQPPATDRCYGRRFPVGGRPSASGQHTGNAKLVVGARKSQTTFEATPIATSARALRYSGASRCDPTRITRAAPSSRWRGDMRRETAQRGDHRMGGADIDRDEIGGERADHHERDVFGVRASRILSAVTLYRFSPPRVGKNLSRLTADSIFDRAQTGDDTASQHVTVRADSDTLGDTRAHTPFTSWCTPCRVRRRGQPARSRRGQSACSRRFRPAHPSEGVLLHRRFSIRAHVHGSPHPSGGVSAVRDGASCP